MSHKTRLFPDYNNILIDTGNSSEDIAFDDDISAAVSVSDTYRTVIFHPYSNMYEVDVEAEVTALPPPLIQEKWDHIVEVSVKADEVGAAISKGFPGTPQIHLALEKGLYRVRISFGGLVEGGCDQDEGNDHYKITFWPDKTNARKSEILKQWPEFIPAKKDDRIYSACVWSIQEDGRWKDRLTATFSDCSAGLVFLMKKNPNFKLLEDIFRESKEEKREITFVVDGNTGKIKIAEYSDQTTLVPNVLKVRIDR